MPNTVTQVQDYIARQPRLARRRRLMRGLIRRVVYTLVKVEISGQENIPDSGPAILMMNHISSIDPVVCMGAVTHRFVVPMAKAEVMDNPLMKFFVRWWGAFIVNRGEIDRQALTSSIELARSGHLVLIAPEGTRHPEGLSQPHHGLAYIATKSDAVVIPTAVSYAQDWKQRLKRFRRGYANIHFGRPFKFETGGRRRIPREALAMMTDEAMYQLARAVQDENARGVYSDLSKATTQFIKFVKSGT